MHFVDDCLRPVVPEPGPKPLEGRSFICCRGEKVFKGSGGALWYMADLDLAYHLHDQGRFQRAFAIRDDGSVQTGWIDSVDEHPIQMATRAPAAQARVRLGQDASR